MLEGKTQKIIKEMKKQGNVNFCNFETPKYVGEIKNIKDNYAPNLKQKGIIQGVPIEKYPYNISHN
jgi:hypothetical protein